MIAPSHHAPVVALRIRKARGIYSFKHALVQDAAYENLLKSRRQVFNVGDDPVRAGLVASLARPGGNLTGMTFLA